MNAYTYSSENKYVEICGARDLYNSIKGVKKERDKIGSGRLDLE